MNRAVRAEVVARSEGECEACGRWVGDEGHADHFFGRGRVKESVSNCWFLCPPCDAKKTNNEPSASEWLSTFMAHCESHGYTAEYDRAQKRLVFCLDREEATARLKKWRGALGVVAALLISGCNPAIDCARACEVAGLQMASSTPDACTCLAPPRCELETRAAAVSLDRAEVGASLLNDCRQALVACEARGGR